MPTDFAAQADTVIIGAGSSGCVVAARLSEVASRSVLLLESGPDRATLPADLNDARRNSMRSHDWGMWHKPREGWLRMPFPRGRVVGGSSAVNTCITLRGDPSDFDAWAARGLPEWSWDKVLPAFCAIESDQDFNDPWHGTSGPLPIARPKTFTPWQAGFMAAAERAGFRRVDDHNAPDATGVGPHAFNRDASLRRINVAEAWLTPAVRTRPNLTIQPDSHVVRVLLEAGRVVGVELVRGGKIERVATKRVVLCAGAVHTPGILLRSGVGPREQLAAMGVGCAVEVPAVGARLLDHPGTALFFRPRKGTASTADPIMQTALRFSSASVGRPNDLQLQPGGNQAFPFPWVTMVTLMAHVGLPAGHGLIRWTSADPFARPVIDSRLMAHPRDRAQAIETMRLAVRLWRMPEMNGLATPLWPDPRVWDRDDTADAQVRRATDSGYHPCGTVPMGAADDPDAATDAWGHVRGTEGLIVADASLIPEITSGNIHLPVLMIGERIGTRLRDASA